jgi:hypothetical protein
MLVDLLVLTGIKEKAEKEKGLVKINVKKKAREPTFVTSSYAN